MDSTIINEKVSVLFDADICKELRISVRTLNRLRRGGAFPIPELSSLDKRHRYSRLDVNAYLAREKMNPPLLQRTKKR